jgi:hypothetical protein
MERLVIDKAEPIGCGVGGEDLMKEEDRFNFLSLLNCPVTRSLSISRIFQV